MFLGIDPGVGGAWAVIDEDTQIVSWFNGPEMINEFLAWQGADLIKYAYLENQQIRHADLTGGKAFHIQKLLINFGQWQGILQSLAIPYRLIMPMTWLARWGCAGRMKPNDRKKAYTEVARKLWPDRKWVDTKDHDLAAATLMADLARVDYQLNKDSQ